MLDDRKPIWRRPDDEVVEEVIIPSLQVTDNFDCMVGYFGGAALRELSHGLASYIIRGQQPLRLLVSPVLSDSDIESVEFGTSSTPEEILGSALQAAVNDEIALASALAEHTKQCFAYLLATHRLVIKIVTVYNAKFHLKEWIFRSASDVAVLSGSANFTGQALVGNVERFDLHRSWRGKDNKMACQNAMDEFEAYWSDVKPHSKTIDLPIALRNGLIESYDTSLPPTNADYRKALACERSLEPKANDYIKCYIEKDQFAPPASLIWETGHYAHQGKAVLRWERAGRRGILSMATGSGKTITALLCAWRLWREVRQLFVIVVAPTLPLLNQWKKEWSNFGVEAYAVGSNTKTNRLEEVEKRLLFVEHKASKIEVVIVTNNFFGDVEFQKAIDNYKGPLLLIADEVHNLGGSSFFSTAPSKIDYRLGLSATPERQYDPDGSAQLVEYFRGVTYEFGLAEAIGVCLVPYDYHLHTVQLDEDELDSYRELSEKIRSISRIPDHKITQDKEELLQKLLNRRRLILESARGKIGILEMLLQSNNIKHTLIYATDKNPDQLKKVNELVRSVGLSFHQITAEETSNNKLVTKVLENFRTGLINVLTAKRVLDKGLAQLPPPTQDKSTNIDDSI